MATTQETDPTAALALLPIPAPETLSHPQVCGRSCLFCAVTLANDSAIDLGKRSVDAYGSTTVWFPRSCRQCLAREAYRALLAHCPLCERCVDDASGCETAVAMRRLMRAGRPPTE